MPKLTFKYSVQGVQDEIQAYLEYIKKNSIAAGLERYAKALSQAYQDIPRETFEAQKQVLQITAFILHLPPIQLAAERRLQDLWQRLYVHLSQRQTNVPHRLPVPLRNVGRRALLLARPRPLQRPQPGYHDRKGSQII